MKKWSLPMMVALALPTMAIAEPSVTLYGVADTGVGWVDSGAAGKSSTMVVESGYVLPSRLGLRGSEDLGNGLKAFFNMESAINIDTGTADTKKFWGRRAVVGLSGSFGEIHLGRDYTPGRMAALSTDIMQYGFLGNWMGFGAGAGGFTVRTDNGIHYSGKFSGLTVRAMYAEGERTSSSGAGDVYGLSGVYNNGPLVVQAYYQESKSTVPELPVENKAVREFGAGAGYTFGDFKVTLSYGVSDPVSALESALGKKTQALGIGASAKIGVGKLLAEVIQIKRDWGTMGKDAKATSIALGYLHPLSKRTQLYGTFGSMRNNSAAAFPLYAASHAVKAGGVGDDPKGIAFGILHKF